MFNVYGILFYYGPKGLTSLKGPKGIVTSEAAVIPATLLCGVASIVLSLSGCPALSVVSHARGREFREFKEYRGV